MVRFLRGAAMSCFVDACPSQAVTGEIDPLRGLPPFRRPCADGSADNQDKRLKDAE